jgi:hypothetical protein
MRTFKMFVTLGKMALLYYYYYVESIAPVANHLYALNSHAGLCFYLLINSNLAALYFINASMDA